MVVGRSDRSVGCTLMTNHYDDHGYKMVKSELLHCILELFTVLSRFRLGLHLIKLLSK